MKKSGGFLRRQQTPTHLLNNRCVSCTKKPVPWLRFWDAPSGLTNFLFTFIPSSQSSNTPKDSGEEKCKVRNPLGVPPCAATSSSLSDPRRGTVLKIRGVLSSCYMSLLLSWPPLYPPGYLLALQVQKTAKRHWFQHISESTPSCPTDLSIHSFLVAHQMSSPP